MGPTSHQRARHRCGHRRGPVRELQQEALSLLAPFGRLCLFAGLPRTDPPVALDTNAIHYKNLVVTGMTGGSPRDYRDALKLIETRRAMCANYFRRVSHRTDVGGV